MRLNRTRSKSEIAYQSETGGKEWSAVITPMINGGNSLRKGLTCRPDCFMTQRNRRRERFDQNVKRILLSLNKNNSIMYSTILFLHNLLRWAVLLGGLYAITKSVLDLTKGRDYTASANRSHMLFVMFCHIQLLLGLVLYFTSPVVAEALSDMGAAMKDSRLRLYGVEHISVNIIAIAIIQTGRILSKKASEPASKHKKALIWFSIGLLLILSRIPWTYSPLFRF